MGRSKVPCNSNLTYLYVQIDKEFRSQFLLYDIYLCYNEVDHIK